MEFLPALPAPTSVEDFYAHPFFCMDDEYDSRGISSNSRSSVIMTARPMSISSPQDIVKLTIIGKKTPHSTPTLDRFRNDDLLQWSYNSDEEVASPLAKDDLSSNSSLSDESRRPSLDDEEEDDVEFDNDSLPELETDEYESVEQRFCEAEVVRIIRAGRAKVIVLSKPTAAAASTAIKRSARISTPPSTPQPSQAIRTPSPIEGVSPTSWSVGQSSTAASFITAASQTSSRAPSTTSSNTASSTSQTPSDAPYSRRRRPSLPFLQTKRNSGHWNPGVPTPPPTSKIDVSTPRSAATLFSMPFSNSSNKSREPRKLPAPLNLKNLSGRVRRKTLTKTANDNYVVESGIEADRRPTPAPSSAVTGRKMSITSQLAKMIPRGADERAPNPILPPFPNQDIRRETAVERRFNQVDETPESEQDDDDSDCDDEHCSDSEGDEDDETNDDFYLHPGFRSNSISATAAEAAAVAARELAKRKDSVVTTGSRNLSRSLYLENRKSQRRHSARLVSA